METEHKARAPSDTSDGVRRRRMTVLATRGTRARSKSLALPPHHCPLSLLSSPRYVVAECSHGHHHRGPEGGGSEWTEHEDTESCEVALAVITSERSDHQRSCPWNAVERWMMHDNDLLFQQLQQDYQKLQLGAVLARVSGRVEESVLSELRERALMNSTVEQLGQHQ
ncbi:hypothetical protein SRHO_G00234670 [Serrasalmus rhombeus]